MRDIKMHSSWNFVQHIAHTSCGFFFVRSDQDNSRLRFHLCERSMRFSGALGFVCYGVSGLLHELRVPHRQIADQLRFALLKSVFQN